MAIQILELHWKMHAARIKLRSHCTRSYEMEHIDIKSSARSRCVELARLLEKEEKEGGEMQFLGPLC